MAGSILVPSALLNRGSRLSSLKSMNGVTKHPTVSASEGGNRTLFRVLAKVDRPWVLYLVALTALVVGLVLHHRFFHDDAFITLRYAERLLAGKGLTWNDGDFVEGFSNPLWLGQIILLNGFGIPLASAAQGLGVFYAFAIFLLWVRAKADPVGLLALVTVPGWTIWAWGGLETLGACFWILVSVYLVWKMQTDMLSATQGVLFGSSLAATALSRPEGIAVSMVLLGLALIIQRTRALVFAGVILGLFFGAYECFRLIYFGDWIANAARAKALGLPFGPQVADALTYVVFSSREWLLTVLVAAWLIMGSPNRRRDLILLCSCLPLLGIIVLGGGDHMLGARLLLAPVAIICLVGSLARPAHRLGFRGVAFLTVLIAACWQLQLSWRFPAERNPAAAVGEWVGRTLEAKFSPGTLVAAATAGSLPFFAPSLAFIDTLGINDRHIARVKPTPVPRALWTHENWFEMPGHRRGDSSYVLSRRPDVVIFGGANGAMEPWFLGDYQLLMSKRFCADYAPWRFFILIPAPYYHSVSDQVDPVTGHLPVTLYVRRGSKAWATVAKQGLPLIPPWSQDSQDPSENR